MKKPASAPPSSAPIGMCANLPDTGTVFSSISIGRTRTGATVMVVRHGDDEWAVRVGDERIVVGKDHAYALVVAEAWCRGRAIAITLAPAV